MKKRPSKPASRRRILIAEDHPLLREGLVQLINRERDLSCCGETDTIAATKTAVATLKPDLLVLDLRLRDGDGLELIKSLKARFPLCWCWCSRNMTRRFMPSAPCGPEPKVT